MSLDPSRGPDHRPNIIPGPTQFDRTAIPDSAEVRLPRWKCHKEVEAAKIKSIELRPADGHIVDAEQVGRFVVSDAWRAKHQPQPGGYFVRYDDGYQSFSPAAAFEAGYTPLNEAAPASPAPYEPAVGKLLDAWQARVVAERAELAERLTKLRAFIGSSAYRALGDIDRDLLWQQERVMANLDAILVRRIGRF